MSSLVLILSSSISLKYAISIAVINPSNKLVNKIIGTFGFTGLAGTTALSRTLLPDTVEALLIDISACF